MPLPLDTAGFIYRWRDKSKTYNNDRLEDVFDHFFTSYVLYNFLYDLIGCRERYTLKGDNELAVNVARKYLGDNHLFVDEILQAASLTIVGLIEEGTFHIRESIWDKERVAKLKTNDPSQWSKGLLELLYAIRCNTFHGKKSFEVHQRFLLQPCIEALERLNDLFILKLEA